MHCCSSSGTLPSSSIANRCNQRSQPLCCGRHLDQQRASAYVSEVPHVQPASLHLPHNHLLPRRPSNEVWAGGHRRSVAVWGRHDAHFLRSRQRAASLQLTSRWLRRLMWLRLLLLLGVWAAAGRAARARLAHVPVPEHRVVVLRTEGSDVAHFHAHGSVVGGGGVPGALLHIQRLALHTHIHPQSLSTTTSEHQSQAARRAQIRI
mmetsp:Transcript_37040/g.71049  ORF Transcript_37040/g.71049 Transcript_37040/m.71049 type:complete len:206 (-) Transcript_37040:688-1305(-)